MGKAVILEDKGLGLYSVRLDVDLTAVNGEIARLEAVEDVYWGVLLKALNTLADLRRTKAEAADGLNEVIDQWKALLLDKLNEEPPAILPEDPLDPETGEPWEDPDRAQEGPLLDAINAERSTPLSRDSALDTAILRHVRLLAATGRLDHQDAGWTPANRAQFAGYGYDPTVGVGQVLAFGTRTPAATVALWMRRSTDRALLLNEDYTECGVAYVYAPKNPYSYLWGVVLATPGPPPGEVESPEPDPAEESARNEEVTLGKIALPTIETFEPDKLGAVAAELAKAAQRVRVAETAVQQLMAERIERSQRLTVLQQVAATAQVPMDVWACRPPDFLSAGEVTDIAEIPGWHGDEVQFVTRTFTIESGQPEQTRSYNERPLNLLPPGLGLTGQLQPTEGMTPAAAFHAAAIEPGWARWKPLWRYGTITAKAGNACSLTLEERGVREIRGVGESLILDSPDQRSLTNVPISYPPCDGDVFYVGDQVLVMFEGQNRDAPKVIGFKFAPRVCPQGRMSWRSP